MNARPIVFCATGVLNTIGGIASANRNVLKAIEAVAAEQDRRVEVLILSESAPATAEYRTFSGRKLAFSLAMLSAMQRAELIIFDHAQIAAPLLLLPRPFRPKAVICAHGSEAGKRIRRSSIRLFRTVDLVLTNSDYTLGNMRRYVDHFNGQACPLGLPPNHVMKTTPLQSNEEKIVLTAADGHSRPLGSRVMLLVGRMDAGEREKGHRELIEVMPRLVEVCSGVQLVFAGSGSDEVEIRKLAVQSRAAAHIFLPGNVVDDQLQKLYRKSYAFVMPSRQEGFGLVYLEAMNYAKPCIACRDDGGAEVVVDGETGYLVDQPINLANLADTLFRLLENAASAEAMGRAGWRRLRNSFSSSAHQERVSGHLRALLAGTPANDDSCSNTNADHTAK